MATEHSPRPDHLPTIESRLREATAARCREISQIAAWIAEQKAPADEELTGSLSPPPNVPAEATLTTKTVDGARHQYWEWHEGAHVRSEYEGPVDD